MNKVKFIAIYIIFGLCPQIGVASLYLPSIFSDNMILQQQSSANIWGKGTPGSSVSLTTSWDNKQYSSTINNDSIWSVSVKTPEASYTSYQIKIQSLQKEIVIDDILLGEVWFCSGQSNMDQKMKGYFRETIQNSLHHAATSTNNNIRCFLIERAGSIEEQFDVDGRWESANPNSTNEFPATGYYFARLLQEAIDIPVAIIACSWGGSKIEAWMPPSSVKKFKELKIPTEEPQKYLQHWTPTILYNGMVSPIAGYNIRGVLWYQGESNRNQYAVYGNYFESMHNEWIKAWNIGDFPIYFCQLAPFEYNDKSKSATFFRDAQFQISKTQPNTSMAVLMDVGEKNNIHPSNKEVIGNRLAYIALAESYGFDKLPYKSPEFKLVSFVNDTVIVNFSHTESGLRTLNGGTPDNIRNFEISGDDKKFHKANAVILPNARVGVSSPSVPKPKAVRYAFNDYVEATLFGANGQPVSSFRTDNWNDIK